MPGWQVRAINDYGTIEADASTWWTFSTGPQPFDKFSPGDGATGQPLNLTLAWTASAGATTYEYCLEIVFSQFNLCSHAWTSTALTSAPLSGLTPNTTYWWQVRAGAVYSNGAHWFTFTTGQPAGAFSKSAPLSGRTVHPASVSLTWTPSSGAASYVYCVDAINDNVCHGSWQSTPGAAVSVSGLSPGTTYWWQVIASNAVGQTAADGGAWWAHGTASSRAPATARTPLHRSARAPTGRSVSVQSKRRYAPRRVDRLFRPGRRHALVRTAGRGACVNRCAITVRRTILNRENSAQLAAERISAQGADGHVGNVAEDTVDTQPGELPILGSRVIVVRR